MMAALKTSQNNCRIHHFINYLSVMRRVYTTAYILRNLFETNFSNEINILFINNDPIGYLN